MATRTILRKGQTGQPTTNGGHFASIARTESDVSLVANTLITDVPAGIDPAEYDGPYTFEVAERDGWGDSEWERCQDARASRSAAEVASGVEAAPELAGVDSLRDRLWLAGQLMDGNTAARIAAVRESGDEVLAVFNDTPSGGYDEIRVIGETIEYRRGGMLHRTDGPARVDAGTRQYAVDGRWLTTPGEDYDLSGIDAHGTQIWKTGGNREASVTAAGDITYYSDGDIHNDGDPAFVGADGHSEWWQRGRLLPDPLPAAPTFQGDRASAGISTGAKYSDVPPRLLMRSIARDIDKVRDHGIVPSGARVEIVHGDSHSGESITVSLSTPYVKDFHVPGTTTLTDTALKMKRRLEAIAGAYQQRTLVEGRTTAENFHLTVQFGAR